jgi:hypothetical protein
VDLERAKTLGPSLRQSRQAVVSFIGTLQKCVASTENGNDTSKKIILLNIQEVQLTLKQSGQSVSYKIPAQDRAEEQENSSAAKSAPNFPVSVTERLTEDQIKSLDIDQVQYAIDAIYGRYGAEFPKRETQAWLERQPWYSGVPGRTPDMVETMFTEDQKFNVDLLAERRNELRSASSESSSEIGSPDGSANSVAGGHNPPGAPTALATPMPTDRPAPADTSQTEPTRPALEGFAELSPERAVTDVWNTNPQNTVANFRRQYSGKTIRYSGTVARKNAKERLIIFKGGGFMTSAYDVQVSLNEDKTPGFSDVAVGDRLVIVATMDRIVPPAFGVGSSSIRLSDGWIYKKSK